MYEAAGADGERAEDLFETASGLAVIAPFGNAFEAARERAASPSLDGLGETDSADLTFWEVVAAFGSAAARGCAAGFLARCAVARTGCVEGDGVGF